jgi:metallo-beta-lactamase class B
VFYCSTSVAGNPLVNNQVYPTIVADYRSSFAKLKTLKADVFLGPHAEFFDMHKKLAARDSGKADAFIDPGEFQRFVTASEADFEKELAAQTAAAPPPAKPK